MTNDKIMTLFNISSPLCQRSAILENIRWTQTAYAVLRQPHHTDMLFSFKSKRKQTKKANQCEPADFSITVGPLVADGLF